MGIDDRLDSHENRIISLEGDMGDVKVDLASIGVKLDSYEVRAEDRFKAISTAQFEMKDLLQERDREARDYRERREQIELEAVLERQRWFRSLVNPQSIMILLAIALSMLGMRAADIHTMASIMGSPLPQPSANEDP